MSDNMLLNLKDYAREVIESKAKEEAGQPGHVLTRMKYRFAISFRYDSNSWTERIKEAAKAARSESLKLLSVMAATRLDVEVDDVKRVLSLALVGDGISDPLALYMGRRFLILCQQYKMWLPVLPVLPLQPLQPLLELQLPITLLQQQALLRRRAPCAGFWSVIDGLNGFMRDQFVGSRGAEVAVWLSEFDLSRSVGRRLERLEV
ncbi:hypothetical protein Droror1_Dr00006308 [Drosera rotundifolia]